MTRSCADIQPQLSLLVDGHLLPEEAQSVRAHLDACATCRALFADLQALREASKLGPVTPPDHLWLEVAGRIRLADGGDKPRTVLRPTPRRSSLSQWLGLAAALVLVTLGLYVFQQRTPAPTEAAAPAGTIEAVANELNQATDHYEKAIAELETMAKSTDGVMDDAAAASFSGSLGAIDAAIAESRQALVADPSSQAARDSLFEALRRKVLVLEGTMQLINEMRQGDQEGAARAAESLGKKS